MTPFEASIFDMDGLLVDSEPLWHRAELEVLGGLGVPLAEGDCRRTKGMFVREVVAYWFGRYPWEAQSVERVAADVVDAVMALVVSDGRLQPGAVGVVELCRARGLPLAVASSSEYRLIDLVLDHFDLADQFAVVHSAEDEPYGKPYPGVYLNAAAKLGMDATRCLAWEDAPAGVLAAKAAQMACVAVPEPRERDRPEVALADVVLTSLEHADAELLERLACADQFARMSPRPSAMP